MNFIDSYNYWKNDAFFDESVRNELTELDLKTDAKEIEDRFYCELEFGTGGMRGVMGAGTNRMNKYTVGKVTKGLGNYLLDTYGAEVCKTRGVVIGYDTRNNSEYFSRIAADVLSRMGIRVYLYAHACPTPQLSFSVRIWNALAGVIVTASHNPKEYNGYKIYDDLGCQLVPWKADRVIAYIHAVADFHDIDFTGDDSLIRIMDATDEFVAEVVKQSRYNNKEAKANLKVIYTPLHGTGNIPVQKALSKDGFANIDIVSEQAYPNGDFPTVVSPNPEDRRALDLGIVQARQTDADIVFGTDPDADRIGVAVKVADGEYELMTGNQIGALMMDFILENTDLTKLAHPSVIKTIVTSELGAEIARKKGLAVFSTLTGFKFIGEKITQFEQAKKDGNTEQAYDFVFGYEESYGYLAGMHARDKDAVVSALLVCEMAAKAKAEGKTLADKMEELYAEYGYYKDALNSFTLKGKDGLEKITSIINELGDKPLLSEHVEKVIDYNDPVEAEPGFGALPVSNVLKYILKDGSWVAIRSSGTEPKIKIYYSIIGSDKDVTEKKLADLQNMIRIRLKLKED